MSATIYNFADFKRQKPKLGVDVGLFLDQFPAGLWDAYDFRNQYHEEAIKEIKKDN